jgi:hypothetical protein
MPDNSDDDVRCKQCGKNFHPSSLGPGGVCLECSPPPKPETPAGPDAPEGHVHP